MKIQKLIFTLSFTLFALTGLMTANGINPIPTSEYSSFTQFNKTMQAELQLTSQQLEELSVLNRAYWDSRKDILNTPNKIGKNTALLACWDKWQMELSNYLTQAQMIKFMQWQSRVDLLSETPY